LGICSIEAGEYLLKYYFCAMWD